MSWQEIFEKREADFVLDDESDEEDVFRKLKLANGYDLKQGKGAPTFWNWIDAYHEHSRHLCLRGGDTAYEVGCGSGVNLFLLSRDGIHVGGSDFSKKLISVAGSILQAYHFHPRELDVLEAKAIPTGMKYDAVFNDGIAQYFPDYAYAQEVLERMFEKARRIVAWIDVHDKAKERAFYEAREKIEPNYQERYKDLTRLFLPKSFFLDFAEAHNLSVLFTPPAVKNYWNAPFNYNVYLYRQ